MAKNHTQKIMKSLMYLVCQKGYEVTITSNRYHTLFSSDIPEQIWKNYKKYSSGILWIQTVDEFATFNFSITKDEFDNTLFRTTSPFKEELLKDAIFFMSIYCE